MRRLLISWAEPDRDHLDELVDWLSGHGYQTWCAPAGDSEAASAPEIRQRLGESDAVIALLSDAWLDSDTCQAQVRSARDLHKPILLVGVAPFRRPLPPHLRQSMIVDFASDKRSLQLSEAFTRLEPIHAPAPPTVSVHRPNRGGHQGLTEELDQSWDLVLESEPTPEPEPPPLSPDTGSGTETPTAPEPVGAQLAGTVFAPAVVAPDSRFLVQVFAHLPEHQEMVAAQAGEFDPDSHRLGTMMFQSKTLAGQRLAFQLLMPGLQIDEPVQTMVWVQSPQSVQFGVTVAPDAGTRAVIGTVIVSRDSVPVGELKFKVSVRKSASTTEVASTAVGEAMSHYRRAFISYCSADRAEVLKRTQMIAQMGIEFFQDILSLEPGDFWEPAIYQEIDRCDVFLLFWSKSAKASEWVAKEWRYALNRHAGDRSAPPRILPVIIEGPPPEPPPKELEYLHFNDPIMYLVKP